MNNPSSALDLRNPAKLLAWLSLRARADAALAKLDSAVTAILSGKPVSTSQVMQDNPGYTTHRFYS